LYGNEATVDISISNSVSGVGRMVGQIDVSRGDRGSRAGCDSMVLIARRAALRP